MGNLEQLITVAWSELKDQNEFLNVVVQELETKGLFNSSGLRTPMSPHGISNKRTTKMGDSFLEFITAP